MEEKKKKETFIEHILNARRCCTHLQLLDHLIILVWKGISVLYRGEHYGSELMNLA